MIATALIDLLSLGWKWIPVRAKVVYATSNAIRWWLGKPTRMITKPGWQWYIPWLGDVTRHSILPQVIETEVQFAGLTDGVTIGVSIGCHYRVVDVQQWFMSVHDFDDSFMNRLQMAFTDAVSALSYEEWLDQDVMADLRESFTTLAEDWGVEILDLNFVNSGKVRPLHITGIEVGGGGDE